MAIPVIMPRQGQSVESCIITKWHKQVGDAVGAGDLLFTYETDKATFDAESEAQGTLLATFFEVGDDVPVLLNVCVIGDAGEDASAFAPEGSAGEAPGTAQGAAQATPDAGQAAMKVADAAQGAAQASMPVSLEDMIISPRARAIALASGADLSRAVASGPDGRVIARDVVAVVDAGHVVTPAAREGYAGGASGTGLGGRVTIADAASAALTAAAGAISAISGGGIPPIGQVKSGAAGSVPESVLEPLSGIRKAIARAMQESLSNLAQLTHTASFDCTQIMALRKNFKDNGAAYGMEGITLGDMILYAAARTLIMPEHRALNAHFLPEGIRYFSGVNLGVAVDTERGLMVPTLFGADQLSLRQISGGLKALAGQARSGALSPDAMAGATFTVSNLGALEIEHFTPVINPPQTGILGINTITTRVREVGGELVAYPCMALSLTYDHRALDGAPASRFLRDLKRNLENFELLLARG